MCKYIAFSFGCHGLKANIHSLGLYILYISKIMYFYFDVSFFMNNFVTDDKFIFRY